MLRPAFVLILVVFAVVLADDEELVVKIKNGLLQGTYMETKKGRKFLGFMGIRYAKPPLGELRFQPPVPIDDWDGLQNAAEIHDMCIQRDLSSRQDVVKGTEDCLFLNVYTPKIYHKPLLPVMMYIHGGAYNIGSGNANNLNPGILLDKDIVLVIINYRLGPMGFLSTGDHVVPGNMGLKDQTLALQWIKENIAHFGGDPNSVTIFGNSAGGTSTHLHMLSPLSKGLFHGAISQSGTATSHWSIHKLEKGIQLSQKLANIFNCPIINTKEMVECLQKVEAEKLIHAQAEYLIWDTDPVLIFGPVIEPIGKSAFISDTPENILKKGLGSDVPWITGTTTKECLFRSIEIFQRPQLLKELNETFDEIAPFMFLMEKNKKTSDLMKQIRTYYFGRADITHFYTFTDMLTDIYFGVGVSNGIKLHKKYLKQPVYKYVFGYKGSFSLTQLISTSDEIFGVSHADELFYLFPLYDLTHPGKLPSPCDQTMSETLVNMWTNFAANKNPTPDGSKHVWNSVQSDAHECLRINNFNNITMEENMSMERIEFIQTLEPYFVSTDQIRDEL